MINLALLTYVASMSVTPGPNNLMLAASGGRDAAVFANARAVETALRH